MSEDSCIAIDMGYSNSSVAVAKGGKVDIYKISTHTSIPTVFSFKDKGICFGEAALKKLKKNPEKAIWGLKRLMGCSWSECCDQADKNYRSFHITKGDKKKPMIQNPLGNNDSFSPEEIASHLFTNLKKCGEINSKNKFSKVVIPVPGSFKDNQRQAVRDAAGKAGFDNVFFVSEPSAAAVAYYSNRKVKSSQNYLVYSLGGGSFDASVVAVDVADDGRETLTVKATKGAAKLGGTEIDRSMIKHISREMWRSKPRKKLSLSDERLRRECEAAKILLSSQNEATISVPSLLVNEDGSKADLNFTITRALFEELNLDLFFSTLELVYAALEAAHMDKTDIDQVLLVGRSSRIPKITQILGEVFGLKKLDLVDYNAVVRGAAIMGTHPELVKDEYVMSKIDSLIQSLLPARNWDE